MACWKAYLKITDDSDNLSVLFENTDTIILYDRLCSNLITIYDTILEQKNVDETEIEKLRTLLFLIMKLSCNDFTKKWDRLVERKIMLIFNTLPFENVKSFYHLSCMHDVLLMSLLLVDDKYFISCINSVILWCKTAIEREIFGRNTEISCSEITNVLPSNYFIYLLELPFTSMNVRVGQKKETSSDNNMVEEIKKILNNSDLYSLLTKFMLIQKNVSSHIIVTVFPQIFEYGDIDVIMAQVWETVSNFYQEDNKLMSEVLTLLCAFADYIFKPSDGQQMSLNILSNPTFWEIIQVGLVHENYLVRKQAIYLLKRSVDIISDTEVLTSSTPLFQQYTKCPKKLKSVWENFIVVFEALEEKQVHLVTPVLPYVEKLAILTTSTSNSDFFIHESWILCLFQRILKHNNVSVVKWGIVHLTKLDLKVIFLDPRNILSTLIFALNNTSLFAVINRTPSECNIQELLIQFFSLITNMPLQCAIEFFTHLLRLLKSFSWGPIPLFYICFALAHCSERKIWTSDILCIINEFVHKVVVCQDIYIRGAVQCLLLQAVIRLADIETISLDSLSQILNCFRKNECMTRRTGCWNKTVMWLQSFLKPNEVNSFFSSNLLERKQVHEMNSLVRLMMMVLDGDILNFQFTATSENALLYEFINKIKSIFHNASSRSYASIASQSTMLRILLIMLEESKPHQTVFSNDKIYSFFYSLVVSVLDPLFDGMKRSSFSVNQMEDFLLYVKILNTLSSDTDMLLSASPDIIKHLQKLEPQVLEKLDKSSSISEKYFCTQLALLIVNVYKTTDRHSDFIVLISDKIFQLLKSDTLIHFEHKSDTMKTVNQPDSQIFSELLKNMWSVLGFHFYSVKDNGQESCILMIEKAMECLQIASNDTIVCVMNAMKILLSFSITDNTCKLLERFFTVCWQVVCDTKTSDVYWPAVHAFISMLFQPNIMCNNVMKTNILQYGQAIISRGDQVTGLVNVLVEQLRYIASHNGVNVLHNYAELVVEGITFGPVHRKDRKIVNEVYKCIEDLGDSVSVNELLSRANTRYADSDVRCCSLDILLNIVKQPEGRDLAVELMKILIDKDKTCSHKTTRYFGDSYIHRLKHRVLQALLVLQTVMTEEDCLYLTTWLCDSLLNENHQHSVRYQQEWLLVRILYQHSSLRDYFWRTFGKASEKRVGSMCSFIAIVFHLCRVVEGEKEERELLIERSIKNIFPWCMGQHFSVRLFAQVSVEKLLRFAAAEGFHRVVQKFSVIHDSLKIILEEEKFIKNCDKLQDDFYFTVFHPIHHFTLETIYHTLPRLANMTSEEWIPVSRLCKFVTTQSPIAMCGKDTELRDFKEASWVSKARASGDEENVVVSIPFSETVQKKIVPWRLMIEEQEAGFTHSTQAVKKEAGLVVVASLVDRTPNLGGLSRTCEVFGVSEYVIGSLQYIEDKQFQSLSKTAEKWISISEVKASALPLYLKEMKQAGYLVIGAEQTDNNTSLHETKFPKKTLLLLGNETEGIPANLLPLLDVCVEIPQLGMVRSLNVHVTGAIFIWEYFRQHSLPSVQ